MEATAPGKETEKVRFNVLDQVSRVTMVLSFINDSFYKCTLVLRWSREKV